MDDFCTCGAKFRTGEDYRDHLPCPGTKEQQEIVDLRTKLAAAEKRAEIAEAQWKKASTNFVQTDWRRCPGCGIEWPHLSCTSGVSCPSCRVGKVKKECDTLTIENDRLRKALQGMVSAFDYTQDPLYANTPRRPELAEAIAMLDDRCQQEQTFLGPQCQLKANHEGAHMYPITELWK
jgi:hypothetical protein